MNHLSILRNVFLGIAALIAVIASTYKLIEAPGIWYDEGFYSQMAMNFADTGRQVIQTAPDTFTSSSFITVGYPLVSSVALSYKLFGVGVLQGRAVMVLFLLGFVLTSYFLIRTLFGSTIASVAAVFLATFPMLYGSGKPVLGEVPGLLFLMLTLIALTHLERTRYRDWRWYVAVGVCAGLCAATKMFFALFIIALVFTLIIRWRSITLFIPGFIAGSIALMLPLALWVYIQFGAEASVPSILAYYANPYSVENLGTHVINNVFRFLTELTPLYTLLMMGTWGASLFLRKHKSVIAASELAAFIFCILVVLSYLRLEGWYRYLFPATIVSLVFFPSSLQTVYEALSKKMRPASRFVWTPAALCILLAFGQAYQLVTTSYVAGYYQATRTKDVTIALSDINTSHNVFLYNTPELGILLQTKNYYQYLSPLPNVIMGAESLVALSAGVPDVVLVGSDVYKEHPEIFNRYKLQQTVDRYEILERK